MLKHSFYLLLVCFTCNSFKSFAANPTDIKHTQNATNKLVPFTSDGCSMFPNGTLDAPSLWVECCIAHDLAYWAGGTLAKKKAADKTLANCVRNKGQKNISELMHSGVKLGGSAYYPTFYRWGYGWPYLRGYKALSADEKQLIHTRLSGTKKQIDDFLNSVTPP